MELKEKVAQMLMIDIPYPFLDDETREHLRTVPWGGVILFCKNIKNEEQLLNLNRQISEFYSIPPIIGVDQEGGIVNRIFFSPLALSVGNAVLGSVNDEKLTEDISFIVGWELKRLGFTINFAPVADVNTNPENPIIGVRSFGKSPHLVSKMVKAYIRGHKRSGIGSCAKHFPGHGDTSFDSHLKLSKVEHSMERMEKVELLPFYAAIEEEVPAIMTAHIIFSALDDTVPATLSHRILTKLLREKMGFKGLIVTDSMSMKAISDHFGVGESAVQSIKAGADIVMMCGKFKDQIKAHQSILKAVEEGEISEERIDKSLHRIELFRKRYQNKKSLPLDKKWAMSRLKEAFNKSLIVFYGDGEIERVNSIVVFSPKNILGILEDDMFSVYPFISKKYPSVYLHKYSNTPPLDNIKKGDLIVWEMYFRHIPPNNEIKEYENKISQIKKAGGKVILVLTGNPYRIPKGADYAIGCFNFLPPSLEQASQYICKLLKSKTTV